jgi:hypothetical protein
MIDAIHTNKLNFKIPDEWLCVYYDIETYDGTHNGVPRADDRSSEIQTICLILCDQDQNIIETIRFVNHKIVCSLPDIIRGSSSEIARLFFEYINAIQKNHLTFLIGFNSSANKHMNFDDKFIPGYDLGFLFAKSSCTYKVTKSYYLKMNEMGNNKGQQIK